MIDIDIENAAEKRFPWSKLFVIQVMQTFEPGQEILSVAKIPGTQNEYYTAYYRGQVRSLYITPLERQL